MEVARVDAGVSSRGADVVVFAGGAGVLGDCCGVGGAGGVFDACLTS